MRSTVRGYSPCGVSGLQHSMPLRLVRRGLLQLRELYAEQVGRRMQVLGTRGSILHRERLGSSNCPSALGSQCHSSFHSHSN